MKNLQPIKHTTAIALIAGLISWLSHMPAFPLDGLQVGMKAPLFKARNLKGKEVALADQMDANVVVIVFWATWSDHSPAVLERLSDLYRKHRREKLGVLAVNVDKQQLTPTELAAIEKIAASLNIPFPILIDEGLRIFREYGVVAVPSTVVLDKEGVIRGDLAAFPLALREDLFDLIDAMAEKRQITKQEKSGGYEPAPRAVRYYNLARAVAGRGMSDAVDQNLKRSMEIDPKFILPRLLLARLYRERGETEEAIEYHGSTTVTATFKPERERYLKEASLLIDKALQLSPQSGAALTEAGLILLSQGKNAAAKQKFLQATQSDASYTPAHFHLAALLVKEGQVKEGEKEFHEALRLNPLDYQAYYTMAGAFEEKGMQRKALEAYKKVYELLYRERILFPYSYGR
jgi:peroxiredoxin/Tfp pilus assembly protein PilF